MHGFGKTLCMTLLLGSVSLAVAAQPPEAQNSDPHLDCTALADQEAPQTGKEWLGRSLWAGHCYTFQARGVRIGGDGVRAMALYHDVNDGGEREVVHFLDGEPLVVERQGASTAVVGSSDNGLPTASPDAIVQHLEDHYRLRLIGEDRIAGRPVVRVDIEPRDAFRYGRQLWLDTETALPLKQMLINERLRVLETLQLVELGETRLHEGQVDLAPEPIPAAEEWQPGWLPPGFESQPVMTGSATSDIAHRVYGDGLATLSLFIEPLHGQPNLKPGLHRLGVSQAVVVQRNIGGRPYQVMAMGELPRQVLQRVAQEVEWDEEAASTVIEDKISKKTANRASDNE